VDGLTIVIPDVHLPYEDKRAVANVMAMLANEQPARVVQIGDLLDMRAPARWSKGRAEEYICSVKTEVGHGIRFWENLRAAVPDADLLFVSGNHDDRLRNYCQTYAPALLDILPSVPELMRLDDFGVRVPPYQPCTLEPGVIGIHGKLLDSKAAYSARKEMLRHGQSIVQGHTHRLGLLFETADRQRFALEAGWLGDIRTAGSYLDFPGVANWQQGFGYLTVDGRRVTPGVVPVHKGGRFTFHGRHYGG
jgi:predicted phosphodiesterase